MNDHHHVAFIHTSNYITLHSDLVQKVNILKIAYGRSLKSRRSVRGFPDNDYWYLKIGQRPNALTMHIILTMWYSLEWGYTKSRVDWIKLRL